MAFRDPEKNRANCRAYYRANRAARLAQVSSWAKANPERHRNNWLKCRFGITLEDLDRMRAEQNGVCAVCRKPETEKRHGKVRALSIDHCHASGRVRGLLCDHCNKALGFAYDDPATLRALADYLEKRSG